MPIVCRFPTVIALLLHLIFGCSLHHAVGCERHDHAGGLSTCVSEASAAHAHAHSHEGETPSGHASEVGDGERQLTSPCGGYHSQPCEESESACHGELECIFVPSSDVVFIIDTSFVTFVTYEHDSMMNLVSTIARRESFRRSAGLAKNSLSHCASLCTWII